jgi:hypothetical protein
MQQLSHSETPRDSKLDHQRTNSFTPIKIVILRSVNQIETCDPANHARREHQRRKVNASCLSNPSADWSDG